MIERITTGVPPSTPEETSWSGGLGCAALMRLNRYSTVDMRCGAGRAGLSMNQPRQNQWPVEVAAAGSQPSPAGMVPPGYRLPSTINDAPLTSPPLGIEAGL